MYPTLDIEYNSVYSTKLEFSTQINEKMKGHEQRYPVWTFPKRTFTLSFNKGPSGRAELENFFEQAMGAAGQFYFKWAKEKGGNDEVYLCSFDADSLEQNIFDYGFTETKLNLVCVDNTPVADVSCLDFYHKAECSFVTEFYTIIDKVFTARNERKSYWDAPKRSWTLTFEKDPVTRKRLEDFFVAKRGRFRSFDWVWEKDRGGDGMTYHVRFDEDSLSTDISDYGFGKLEVKIKEVFPNQNPFYEVEKDEIIPRKLLKIELEGGSVYIMDNETLESLTFDGETYLGAPLSHGDIEKDDNSSVSKLSIELSNVGLSISGIIGQRGDVITDAPAVLTLVFLDVNTNTILPDYKQVLYAGHCNNLKLDYETATVDIETSLGGYELQAPVMKYRTSCQVRRFKDCRCKYSGSATSCDRTFERCKELGNQANFAGFPQMYNELVIKV